MRKPVSYRGPEPFAFVAYAHRDEPRVHAELNRINSLGFRTFYDDGIHPGHRWREDIAEAIDAAALFVFFVTPRSIASEDCLRELNYALDQRKQVVAVYLEETPLPGGVRLAISDRQAILAYNMDADDYHQRLQAALAEYLPPQRDYTDGAAASTAPASTPTPPPSSAVTPRRWPRHAAIATALVALVVFGVWQLVPQPEQQPPAKEEPATAAGLSRADALELLRDAEAAAAEDQYGTAFLLILQIGSALEGHPDLDHLKADILRPATPQVSEADADVWFRPMQLGLDSDWVHAGATPLEPFDAPLGVLELRVEKPGFEPGRFVVANPGPLLGNHYPGDWNGPLPSIELAPSGPTESDFVPVPAAELPVIIQGAPQGPGGTEPVSLPRYGIARTEVTNHDFKAFVDAGGYELADYWQELAFEDGTPFVLAEHIDSFVDTTGRHAPAGWELGNYLPGTADVPVGGISWFEAMAFARFRGQSLPTVYHWARAAQGPLEAGYPTVPVVAHLGNFTNDAGPRPADSAALGPWGTSDMAGNVREWVINATSRGRLAMGGSWNDYQSNYFAAYSIKPLNRAPDNGLRLIEQPSVPEELSQPVTLLIDTPLPFREPVPDAFFEGLKAQLVTRHAPPSAVQLNVLEDSADRRIEEVVLRYPNAEELTLYIGLPATGPPPTQFVVYMPSGGAFLSGKTPNRSALGHFHYQLDFIIRSGRAAVVPIWFGSRDRYRNIFADAQHLAVPAWHADAGRTLDYLASRTEGAQPHFALMGFSFGAAFGSIILASEPRFETGVLISGGIISSQKLHPMFDLTNFAPRIRQPVLLVNGKFDPIIPYGLSQLRLLELLPNAANQQVLFDELGHWGFPRHRFYRAVTDWLDAHLGAPGL